MNDIRVEFGNRVRALRKSKQFTLETLGVAANLNPTYLSGIERGRRNPTIVIIARIAKALDCTEAELFTFR